MRTRPLSSRTNQATEHICGASKAYSRLYITKKEQPFQLALTDAPKKTKEKNISTKERKKEAKLHKKEHPEEEHQSTPEMPPTKLKMSTPSTRTSINGNLLPADMN